MSVDEAKRHLRAALEALEDVTAEPAKPRITGFLAVRKCGHVSMHATEDFARFMAGYDKCPDCSGEPSEVVK